jgi:hypothetical protein
MNDWYFYQEHGKTVGPLSNDELRTRIRDGQVRLFDLIFREGESTWRMALEHSNLRSEFKTNALGALRERPWVCLQRKLKDGTEFTTTGPFSEVEIRKKLQSGEISYSDYAWKDKFYEWKRIGSLEEFNPRSRSENLPPVPRVDPDSSADLLKDVVEFQRQQPAHEWIPEEASGESLAEALPSPVITIRESGDPHKHKTAKMTPPPLPTQQATAPSRPQPEQLLPESDSKPLLDWGLVGVLILILAGSVLIISRFVQLRPTPMPTSPTVVEVPPPPEPPPPRVEPKAQPKDDLAASEKPVEKPKPKPPTVLLLSVQTVNNQAHIDLRSDASAEFPVNVQIIGFPGQVSEGGAYYRFLHIAPPGNLAKALDLSGLKLPEGHFIVRADSEDLSKEVKFSWGLNDPQFKTTIAHQRKQWSATFWRERLALFHLCELLEKQLTLAPKGKLALKGLESLASLKRSNSNNYLLFDDWWELHQIVSDGKEALTPQLLARTQHEHERLATFSVWK